MFLYINKLSLKKLVAILFIVGFFTYLSSFSNQFVWDDDHFFYQNILTQNLSHIKEIFLTNTTAGAGAESNYYRPLATISFALDHAIWGWNPIGFHLTATLFHIFNSIVLFLFLLKLRFGKTASFLISIIFLIHPIQTEAVTYLSDRGNVLYMFFLLVSIYLFTITLYDKHITPKFLGKKIIVSKNILLFIAVLLFPLSILSKEGALTTSPIYIGILFVFAIQQKINFHTLHRKYKNHFLVILFLVLISIIYFGLRLTILNFGNSLNYSGDQGVYGTHVTIRILTFLKTIPIYTRLLFIPYPLYLERTTTVVTSLFDPYVLISIMLIVLSTLLGYFEPRKLKTVWIFFALILIFSNLVSVSGIIPMTGLLRENWLYMPMIGFFIIVFMIIRMFFFSTLQNKQGIWSGIFIIISLVYIGMTIQQNYNWRNRIAYFEHNLKFTNTARLHLNLGNAYIGKGQYDKAFDHLQQAVKIADYYPQTHYNLGSVYLHRNNFPMAEKEFLKSLSLNPSFLFAYSPLISIYEHEHQYKKAISYLLHLNQIYPQDLKLTLMLGNDLYANGDVTNADIQFAKALKLSHNDPELIKAIAETKGKR